MQVGAALAQVFAEGVVSREQLFITGKLWNDAHKPEDVRLALLRTLTDLGLQHLDLYLVHWPVTGVLGDTLQPSTHETWSALEACVMDGLVRSIGVSNFSAVKLAELLEGPASGAVRIKPSVLQIEAHPYWPNERLRAWAVARGLHVTAYSPLGSQDSAAIMRRGSATKRLLQDPVLLSVAHELGRTAAQVVVWLQNLVAARPLTLMLLLLLPLLLPVAFASSRLRLAA